MGFFIYYKGAEIYRELNSEEITNFNNGDKLKIVKVAKYFDEHFNNKIIIYKSESNIIQMKFDKIHLMHLTGIKHKKGARVFYKEAKRNKLNVDNLLFKKDGTTTQKLLVIEHTQKLLTKDIELLDGGITLKMSYDNVIRTKEFLIALLLKNIDDNLIPYSLFNISKKENFKRGEPVKEIYSKCLKTGEVTKIL